jgi:hypothetical protein
VNPETWAIVGVIVGAVLGGGAQLVADVLRSKRERQRWIDDHRRAAYLTALETIDDMAGAIQADVLNGLSLQEEADHDKVTWPPARAAYFQARHTVEFYGSVEVIRLLYVAENAILGEMFMAPYDKKWDVVHVMRETVGPAVIALSSAMRKDLGIANSSSRKSRVWAKSRAWAGLPN